MRQFESAGALWTYTPGSLGKHARLRSGKHSGAFCNSRFLIADEKLLQEAAFDLVSKLESETGSLDGFDGIVGPKTGGTKLAELMAQEITEQRGRPCFSVATEKIMDGSTLVGMKLSEEDASKVNGRTLVVCDDVFTTGGSIRFATEAVISAGAKTLPFYLVMVNRSGQKEGNGNTIITLVNHTLEAWEAKKCPLCEEGSEPLEDPKDNWKELTGRPVAPAAS